MLPLLAAALASSVTPETTLPELLLADTTAVEAPELAPGPSAPGFDLAENTMAALSPEDIKPEEYGKWHGSLTLGMTIADGNTERTSYAATGKAENRREKDRFTFDLLWNYTEEDDDITQRRAYGSAKYDYFATKKLYYLGQLSGESDHNASLDLRTILAAGVGYQFREDEVWKIAGEAGLAYVDEDYEGTAFDEEFPAGRLAYKVDYKPSEKWSAGQYAQFYPSLEDSDDMNAIVDTNAKLTLSEKLFAQFQWLFTWDNTPVSGAHHVDNLFLLTLGWSF